MNSKTLEKVAKFGSIQEQEAISRALKRKFKKKKGGGSITEKIKDKRALEDP